MGRSDSSRWRTFFSASAIGIAPEPKPPLHSWLQHRYGIFFFLLACAVINPHIEHGLQPIAVKGRFEFPASHLFRQWNPFSRVVVGQVKRGIPEMWGLAYVQTALARGPQGGGVRQGNLVASITLLVLFFISLIFSTAAVVVPLRNALQDVGPAVAIRGTAYFALIGIGFMMVEIGLLQRMTICLGHPVYSLSVLLFSLILTTGMGSFLSEKLTLDNRAKITTWAILTGGYLMILLLVLSESFAAFNDTTLVARITLCVLSITPAGLLLGFGFPTGMRLIASIDSRPTPWFWGINGAAGVLASISAIAVSLAVGIKATLIVGALCYFLLIPVSLALVQPQALVQPNPVKFSKKQPR